LVKARTSNLKKELECIPNAKSLKEYMNGLLKSGESKREGLWMTEDIDSQPEAHTISTSKVGAQLISKIVMMRVGFYLSSSAIAASNCGSLSGGGLMRWWVRGVLAVRRRPSIHVWWRTVGRIRRWIARGRRWVLMMHGHVRKVL
jgi:hypothetical protein